MMPYYAYYIMLWDSVHANRLGNIVLLTSASICSCKYPLLNMGQVQYNSENGSTFRASTCAQMFSTYSLISSRTDWL